MLILMHILAVILIFLFLLMISVVLDQRLIFKNALLVHLSNHQPVVQTTAMMLEYGVFLEVSNNACTCNVKLANSAVVV